MTKTYTTKEIAHEIGIHVNTVRFYEEIGFLTKPARRANGYRIYTDLQLAQCRLIRRAMQAEILQNGLRNKAIQIVRLSAASDYTAAQAATDEYLTMLGAEVNEARSAINAVESILAGKNHPDSVLMKRHEAARALSVTSETLRTWERSGLISVHRHLNGYRVYTAEDLDRLKIIRTLRLANYSLTAILRLLHSLDRHTSNSVESILNTPDKAESIVSVCDRLIVSLESTLDDAQIMKELIKEIELINQTLQ